LLLLFCCARCRCHSFEVSHPHLTFIIINLLFVPVIFKRGEAKVDDGQLFPHDNKEDENLQLKGQGGSGSNQTKLKVRALFLKLCTTMPYTTAFVVARGVLQARGGLSWLVV
jgi:hypothetical protein